VVAGWFTDLCIVQIGPDQERFFRTWRDELLPLLSATEIEGVTMATGTP
jgi:hypothetical protein